MKRFQMLAALLTTAALAACAAVDEATAPTAPEQLAAVRNPVVPLAIAACAQCHGANLLGANTDVGNCPSLVSVRYYTAVDFDALLNAGVKKNGNVVAPMTMIAKLNASEREALRDYLLTLREPE